MPTLELSLPLFALLVGCTSVEPETALREFADFNAVEVYDASWAEVGESWELNNPVEYFDMADNFTLSAVGGQEGDIEVEYTLSIEESSSLDDEWTYSWSFEVDYSGVQLDSCTVDGSGTWTVEHVHYDHDWVDHAWDGQLGLDGADLQDVSYEAYFSGNLHWVQGSIGDVVVDWENDNPDLP